MALIAARLFGLFEVHVLGAGMILAPLVSMILVLRPLALPVVSHSISPSLPREGDRLTIVTRFATTRRTPAYDVRLQAGGRGVAVGRLHARASLDDRAMSFELTARRRGELAIGPTELSIEDPLSLSRRVITLDDSSRVLIHPGRTATVAPSLHRCQGHLIDALRRAHQVAPTDGDFRGVREYQRGDDTRRVNWKASAKRDLLLVNEFDPDADVVLQVIADSDSDRHSEESFDVAMRVAASLVDCSPSSDTRVELCMDGATTRIESAVIALDRLALATTRPDARLEAPDSPDPTAALARVVVTGHVDQNLRGLLTSMTPSHGAALVVACGGIGAELPTGWMSLECANLDDFARRWSEFVRSAGRNG